MPVNAAATTSASGPGPLASPTSEGNTSTPALNSTSCYVVNANGTVSTNSTLSLPGVPRPSLSPPSAWYGQINATNATTIWFNSSVFCVQYPATQTATPFIILTPTSGPSPGASHHALNISETRLTKTSTVSTTSSLHPISKSSGVTVTSSTRVVPVTPSSRSSSPPATPKCSPPTHTKSASSSVSSRTSARSTVVEPNLPPPPPTHTTTRPSPTTPGAPKSPNTVSPVRPAVPSSASVTGPKKSSPVWPSESSPTTSGAPELPNTVFPSPVFPTESFPTAPGAPELPDTISPVLPAVPSSASVAATLSSVAPFPPASVTGLPTGFPTGLGTSRKPQSTHSTITSTVTETPETTFSTPVSITETTDGHVTITAPPLITTTGLSSLSDGTVVTVTHVIANPPKQANSGSSRDTFFGNHAAVVGVFLAAGFIFAGLVLLVFCCFRRRRRRRAQRRGSRLPEISHPRTIQNPFADVTGNPAVRERASPNIRWHGFMQPRGPASTTHSSISSPLNRSEENLPAAHSGAPVPPPPVQRAASRSSYRIPVPYADVLSAHGNENQRSTGAPSEYPQTQPSDVPPRLPMRSPLRLLAAQNMAKIPPGNALNLSLSRASTPSVYPPSVHHPDVDADVDSLHQEKEVVASVPPSSLERVPSGWLTRGLSYGTKSGQRHKADRNNGESHQTSPVDSDGTRSLSVSASSSSHARYSPLESPASDTGTALTSIQDGIAHNRKVSLPRTPPVALFMHQVENRKSGARHRS